MKNYIIVSILLLFNINPLLNNKNSLEDFYGLVFEGDWTIEEKIYVFTAVRDISIKLQTVTDTNLNNGELFRKVFECPIFIEKSKINYVGAVVYEYKKIRFYGFYYPEKYIDYKNKSIRLVVHEFGHIFDISVFLRTDFLYTDFEVPREVLGYTYSTDKTFPRRPLGFYGPFTDWQMSHLYTTAEEFADMFIGWTYDKWSDDVYGERRKNWMDEHMIEWINLFIDDYSQPINFYKDIYMN